MNILAVSFFQQIILIRKFFNAFSTDSYLSNETKRAKNTKQRSLTPDLNNYIMEHKDVNFFVLTGFAIH